MMGSPLKSTLWTLRLAMPFETRRVRGLFTLRIFASTIVYAESWLAKSAGLLVSIEFI